QLHSENIFAFNAGFGARFRVNKRYSFRIDVRDNMSRAVRYQIPRSASINDPKYQPPPVVIPATDTTPEITIIPPSTAPKVQVFPLGGLFHQVTASIAFVYHF